MILRKRLLSALLCAALASPMLLTSCASDDPYKISSSVADSSSASKEQTDDISRSLTEKAALLDRNGNEISDNIVVDNEFVTIRYIETDYSIYTDSSDFNYRIWVCFEADNKTDRSLNILSMVAVNDVTLNSKYVYGQCEPGQQEVQFAVRFSDDETKAVNGSIDSIRIMFFLQDDNLGYKEDYITRSEEIELRYNTQHDVYSDNNDPQYSPFGNSQDDGIASVEQEIYNDENISIGVMDDYFYEDKTAYFVYLLVENKTDKVLHICEGENDVSLPDSDEWYLTQIGGGFGSYILPHSYIRTFVRVWVFGDGETIDEEDIIEIFTDFAYSEYTNEGEYIELANTEVLRIK